MFIGDSDEVWYVTSNYPTEHNCYVGSSYTITSQV
jgi:hypothetical protein